MSNIRHQIILGNCGNDINEDLVPLPLQSITWDSTKITFDNTIITFDHT